MTGGGIVPRHSCVIRAGTMTSMSMFGMLQPQVGRSFARAARAAPPGIVLTPTRRSFAPDVPAASPGDVLRATVGVARAATVTRTGIAMLPAVLAMAAADEVRDPQAKAAAAAITVVAAPWFRCPARDSTTISVWRSSKTTLAISKEQN